MSFYKEINPQTNWSNTPFGNSLREDVELQNKGRSIPTNKEKCATENCDTNNEKSYKVKKNDWLFLILKKQFAGFNKLKQEDKNYIRELVFIINEMKDSRIDEGDRLMLPNNDDSCLKKQIVTDESSNKSVEYKIGVEFSDYYRFTDTHATKYVFISGWDNWIFLFERIEYPGVFFRYIEPFMLWSYNYYASRVIAVFDFTNQNAGNVTYSSPSLPPTRTVKCRYREPNINDISEFMYAFFEVEELKNPRDWFSDAVINLAVGDTDYDDDFSANYISRFGYLYILKKSLNQKSIDSDKISKKIEIFGPKISLSIFNCSQVALIYGLSKYTRTRDTLNKEGDKISTDLKNELEGYLISASKIIQNSAIVLNSIIDSEYKEYLDDRSSVEDAINFILGNIPFGKLKLLKNIAKSVAFMIFDSLYEDYEEQPKEVKRKLKDSFNNEVVKLTNAGGGGILNDIDYNLITDKFNIEL